MARVNAIDNLVTTRNLLNTSLENSRALSFDLHRTGQRLKDTNDRLSSLEAVIRSNIHVQNCSYAAIKDQICSAIAPAMGVLKVCNTIQELRKSLSSDSPRSHLSGYLLLAKQLEQALEFLAANCGLAIQWLEGILQFLEHNKVTNDFYVFNVKKSLSILQDLQATEGRARFRGGILCDAFDKLEIEFKHLLSENCILVPLPFLLSSFGKHTYIAPSPLPASVMRKLQAIISRLKANHRLDTCILAYAEVRSMNAKISLETLDLTYLQKSVTDLDHAQDTESYIDQWSKHLESAVTHVFEFEYALCNEVFSEIGLDIRIGCFAKIAMQSGILSFLQFGARVTECKKDPVKLLKLLDMFACLDNLRVDFNRLFCDKACADIQNLTRDLIKKVVSGACEIFWELPLQVELQRGTSCPSDGSVPSLVSFVTDYCNYLLGEDYKSLLVKLLTIHQSWKNDTYSEALITSQIYRIIKEIGMNLDTWSKAFEDTALSYLFMMNNHCHFCTLEGTKLGELMGDSWLRGHEQYKDYYMTVYLRETWGKIVALLFQDQEGDSVKKRLKEFNEALDGMYEKQSNWVVPNEKLRLKICRVAVQAFVPVYRNYLQSYGHLAQEDVKYTAQGLESMLSSLFQPKIRMYSSSTPTYWIDEVKNIETAHFHKLTLMAV